MQCIGEGESVQRFRGNMDWSHKLRRGIGKNEGIGREEVTMRQRSTGAKTIKKNTNSTQNKSQTHRAKQYQVTSFLSTDCELSTETCSKNFYSLGPWIKADLEEKQCIIIICVYVYMCVCVYVCMLCMKVPVYECTPYYVWMYYYVILIAYSVT